MAAIYYTLAAITLYVFSDWLLQRVEIACGRRLEYRSIYFFVILLLSSLFTFSLIRQLGA